MKKNIIKSFFVLSAAIFLTSCGKDKTNKVHCGVEMSAFQAMELKKIGNEGYTFSDDDKKLAADVIETLNGLFDNKYKFNLGFIERNDQKISLYVIVSDDEEVIDKVSCYLMQHDFDGRLPETRNLLFYTESYDKILIGIKNDTSAVEENAE